MKRIKFIWGLVWVFSILTYKNVYSQKKIVWTGAVDTDWHKPCNWKPPVVPTCSDTVYIPTTTSGNYPVITAKAQCKELNITTAISNALTIQPGGTIEISSAGGSCISTPTLNSAPCNFCITIGGPQNDFALNSLVFPDGSIITVGYSNSFSGSNLYEGIIVKLDPAGNIIWSKRYFISGSNVRLTQIITTPDNNLLVGGVTDVASGDANPLLIKMDTLGNIIWSRYIDIGGADSLTSIIAPPDNFYYVVGVTDALGVGKGDMFFTRVSSIGSGTKVIVVRGSQTDVVSDIVYLSPDRFMVTGYTNSWGAGNEDIYFAKWSFQFPYVLWEKVFGNAGDDRGHVLKWMGNNRLLILGLEQVPLWLGWAEATILLEIDTLGNIVSSNIIDNYRAYTYADVDTVSGKYIITSIPVFPTSTEVNILDYSLNINKSFLFNGAGSEVMRDVKNYLNQAAILSGYTNSFGAGLYDFYLVKVGWDASINLCPNGCDTTEVSRTITSITSSINTASSQVSVLTLSWTNASVVSNTVSLQITRICN